MPVAAMCCKVLHMGKRVRVSGVRLQKPAVETPRTIRASVSLRADLYRTLEAMARQKKVSTAWVLREAAEKYVGDEWPLFKSENI